MKKNLIGFVFLFLMSCGGTQEEKLILGNWKVDFEKSWNKKINSLNKKDKQRYEQLPITNKKKRLANYQLSIEGIQFRFKEDKTYEFLASHVSGRTYTKIINKGDWEVFLKDENPFLILKNVNGKKDIFEIEEVNKTELRLKTDKSNNKLILGKN